MKASQIPQKLVTLLALSMLLLLSACAKKHDIVGTWVGTDQVSTINETVTLTLNSDKSYVGEIKLSGTRPDAEITMTERGTYRMEGEGRLVTVGHDYAYDNIPKGREDQMRELMEKDKDKDSPDTITWIDDDTITLAGSTDHPITMKRQK